MTFLFLYLFFAILVSFLCSVWEAVLLSITPSYIKRKENESPELGKRIRSLKDDIDKPLSAILSLNTIAHTVGAIGVGAEAAIIFGTAKYAVFGVNIPITSVVAALMTLAILFLSEIIPKTIGATNWKALTPFTANALRILVFALKPFVWLSGVVTRFLKSDKDKSVFSRRDFAAMADVINESGEISEGDHTLIKNVLAFDDLTAYDIMTPRTVMVMADETQTIGDFYESQKGLRFSRIPLHGENRDEVTGLFLKDELMQAMIEGKKDKQLRTILRPINVVTVKLSLRKLFKKMNDNRDHISVVVDEYGGLQGLVTLEDIFETLFGLEIMDETDSVKDLQQYARQQWENRARKLGLID